MPDTDDVYDEEEREASVEDDEMTAGEEGFMQGYEQASEEKEKEEEKKKEKEEEEKETKG